MNGIDNIWRTDNVVGSSLVGFSFATTMATEKG